MSKRTARLASPAIITAVSAGERRVDFPDAPITVRESDRLTATISAGATPAAPNVAIGIHAPAPPAPDGRLPPITDMLGEGAPIYLPRSALPPAGAVWNNIRRAWMVPGPDGALVVADPQPPPPASRGVTVGGRSVSNVPPAVKISA